MDKNPFTSHAPVHRCCRHNLRVNSHSQPAVHNTWYTLRTIKTIDTPTYLFLWYETHLHAVTEHALTCSSFRLSLTEHTQIKNVAPITTPKQRLTHPVVESLNLGYQSAHCPSELIDQSHHRTPDLTIQTHIATAPSFLS